MRVGEHRRPDRVPRRPDAAAHGVDGFAEVHRDVAFASQRRCISGVQRREGCEQDGQEGECVFHKPYFVQPSVNPATIHLLSILQRESRDGVLLIAPYVNDRQGEVLRAAGVHFMDSVGNAFITAPGVHILVSGRRLARVSAFRQKSRAFHPSGLQLLFALLTDPNLDSKTPGVALVGRPYRDIAAVTGISHSTVGWIMADLIQQGLIVQVDSGLRVVVERVRILERWIQGYLDRLRPSIIIERYQPASANWWQAAKLEGGLWSGEVAAALLTDSLKPGTVTIFGERPSHAFVLQHQLQKDSQGSVEFLKPIWRLPHPSAWEKHCVHPLLVYADLMSINDDRTREAASNIYDRYLRSIIETA